MSSVYFVVPWFPERAAGGAEFQARHTVEAMRRRGVDARVLTTCVPDFRSDWGVDVLPRGRASMNGVPVERFPVDRRDWRLFDEVNLRLMRGAPVTPAEACVYVEESIRSRALEARLADLPADAVCVYMPYMFGTTYWGMQARPGWLLPCLHDEPYARLPPFADMFRRASGVLCNSLAERDLVLRLFDLPRERVRAVGEGVEATARGDAARFRARTGVEGPFVLCVARKDHGKNVDVLLQEFAGHRLAGGRPASLVLIGAGTIAVPAAVRDRVIDLGYVDESLKWDAYAAAAAHCVPGLNESFSLVLMESWLQGTPALVNADCAVTSDHVRAARGGLAYAPGELGACLDWILDHPDLARRMGRNGGEYVRRNFSWDVVVGRLRRALAI